MTAVNFTKPVTSDLRADVLQYIRNYMDGQAKLFDGDTLTSPPTGAIRYSAAGTQFEKWNGAAWGALSLGFLPLAGGTLTGSLTGTSANFTTALQMNGNAVWHAGNLTPSNYLALAGGTLTGGLTTRDVAPEANNTRSIGTDLLRYAAVYATNFYEAGAALSSKYALSGHTHSYLPLSGGTLSGSLTGTSGAFSSLTVGGTAVSLSGHTHSYLPLGGGTLTGALVTATAGIELGHATDTTLARIAAGRASVETREIVTLGFSASSAKITRGTTDPVGGADGDIYFQYT